MNVQLTEPFYSDGTEAVSVVPSYGTTAHKAETFAQEGEVRVEGYIEPHHLVLGEGDVVVRWPVASFAGLAIRLGARVPPSASEEIRGLAAELGISVHPARIAR